MRKGKSPKAWVAYKLAKVGKRLGVVHGETESDALREATGSSTPRPKPNAGASTCAASDNSPDQLGSVSEAPPFHHIRLTLLRRLCQGIAVVCSPQLSKQGAPAHL